MTSFIGRSTEIAQLRNLISHHRLVTLTGTGGVGKTRLAWQLAEQLGDRIPGGIWWVDLAPVAEPSLVADRIAHTLGIPEHPGRRTLNALTAYFADQQALLVVDNCEHLIDSCAAVITALLVDCAQLAILATSREPLAVSGELTFPTPPLSLADEAAELFIERAQLTRPGFAGTGDDATQVAQICTSLDGIPLAIELAATRMRVLSLTEIADGLGAGLDLLAGGARTVEPRHRTLRGCLDWSHNLLGRREQLVFRRLALFQGGFDVEAARAVAAHTDLTSEELVDILTQLVDKSLLTADNAAQATRYRLLEPIRQYALEKLDEHTETEQIQARHRDHYTAVFTTWGSDGYRWNIERSELEIDNVRAAFACSLRHDHAEVAARLATSLMPLWIHSHALEGLAWFDAILTHDSTVTPATRARTLADKTTLQGWSGYYDCTDQADQAVAIARALDNRALLGWTLAARGLTSCYEPQAALPYLREAVELAPASADDWRHGQILSVYSYSTMVGGDLITARGAGESGRVLAEASGDWSGQLLCRYFVGLTQLYGGDLVGAAAQAEQMLAECRTTRDPLASSKGLMLLAKSLAHQGDTRGACAAAEAGVKASANLADFHRGISLGALVDALLADGDVSAATAVADNAAATCGIPRLLALNCNPVARATLAAGDPTAARRSIDDALSTAFGAHRVPLLELRVQLMLTEGALEQVERTARAALHIATETEAFLAVPELIESLAIVYTNSGRHPDAARLFGSAAGIRERTEAVRFKIYDADHAAAVATLRTAMDAHDFKRCWAAGAACSTIEAIKNAREVDVAQKRPADGWAALTAAELNVAALVAEGLRSKDIAAKLFISPRTVEAHLAHIYAKLGVSSRVHLAREVARNS